VASHASQKPLSSRDGIGALKRQGGTYMTSSAMRYASDGGEDQIEWCVVESVTFSWGCDVSYLHDLP
jgi:hypothetical protein